MGRGSLVQCGNCFGGRRVGWSWSWDVWIIAARRVIVDGTVFTIGTSLLGIHTVAHGGSDADGCHVGTGIFLRGWVEGDLGAILRCWRHSRWEI